MGVISNASASVLEQPYRPAQTTRDRTTQPPNTHILITTLNVTCRSVPHIAGDDDAGFMKSVLPFGRVPHGDGVDVESGLWGRGGV